MLLIGVVVVAAVVLRTRSSSVASPSQPLAAKLAAWVELGLIDREQAERIADYEVTAAPAGVPVVHAPTAASPVAGSVPELQRRPALVAMIEILGYLGGALAVTGVVLLVANFWADLAVGAQLALSSLTAAALIGAGLAVPERARPGDGATPRLPVDPGDRSGRRRRRRSQRSSCSAPTRRDPWWRAPLLRSR